MVYTLRFFPFQIAVCFIILKYFVPVLFTFYIKGVLKLKKQFRRQKGNYNQQDAPIFYYLFLKALHISGGSSAHHH